MKNRNFKRLILLSSTFLLLLFLQSSFAEIIKKTGTGETTKTNTKRPNPILKSSDGGLTWQDISDSMPVMDESALYYAGATGFYVQAKNTFYSTDNSGKKPTWVKENIPGFVNQEPMPSTMIAFNNSGAVAFNYDGSMYSKQNGSNN